MAPPRKNGWTRGYVIVSFHQSDRCLLKSSRQLKHTNDDILKSPDISHFWHLATTHDRQYMDKEVKPRSTFTFMRGLSYTASVLVFTHGNFTRVCAL